MPESFSFFNCAAGFSGQTAGGYAKNAVKSMKK